MKTRLTRAVACLALGCSTFCTSAQERIETVWLTELIPHTETLTLKTNTITVAAGEVFTTLFASDNQPENSGRVYLAVETAGQVSRIKAENVTVAGPAVLRAFLLPNSNLEPIPQGGAGFLTYRIDPPRFPPGKTLAVSAGTKSVDIIMESSTTLVDWIPATLGTYTALGTNLFFRIRAEKITN